MSAILIGIIGMLFVISLELFTLAIGIGIIKDFYEWLVDKDPLRIIKK